MEFRKIFDTIPEQFDKYRPRYSQVNTLKLEKEKMFWRLDRAQVRQQSRFSKVAVIIMPSSLVKIFFK